MKRQILISLISLSSILTVNAQWNPNGDNFLVGKLMLKNMNNTANAGNSINFTSYGDDCIGPRIRSSLSFASGTNSKSSLILSSYWEGYKDELILSGGNIGMNANVTLKNWTNTANAGNSINFTSYGDDCIGPRIRSSLSFASGTNSKSSLILSSYWEGYKDELILSNGKVGIGTACPQYTLDVAGTIRADEVKVDLTRGCDFVFKSDYKLMNLQELESFVKVNQHLPEVATEKEMVDNGVNMKELQMKLLQKMEEMTLYMIEQNKKLEQQNEKIMTLENEIKELKTK